MNKKLLAATTIGLLLTACSSTTPIPDQQAPSTPDEPPVQSIVAEAPARPFPGDSLHDLLVAEFALQRNRYDLALGNYMHQAHETRDPGVIARAARLAQFLKADNASMDAALLWTEVEPENMEGQYTLATMLAKQGRAMEAVQHMTEVLDSGGNTNFAAIAASALKLDDNKRNELEQEFDRLLVLHSDNTQLLTSKALLLQQRGETEEALTTIRTVLKLDPQDLHAIVIEARLLQQLGRIEEAFTRLEQVVSLYPHNRRLRLQYARMLMSKDIPAAKHQFELLLSTTPNDTDLLLSLGLISKENGEIDEAEEYFQRLLTTGERDTEAHFYLAQILEEKQLWQQAINHYQRIPPGNDYMAAVSRITALYAEHQPAQAALRYLHDIRRQHPEYSVRLYLLESEVLLKADRTKEGQQLLSEALLLHPRQVSLLYARSMVSEKLGQFDLMEQDLTAIVAQEPDNAIALNALGYILANRSQRLDEAYQMIQRALTLKPNDPAILDSLGWVEYRRGNMAQAIQLLGQAYQNYPDPEVAAHLGEVLWVAGEHKHALSVWQQGLQRSPNNTYINETLHRLGVKLPAATPANNPADNGNNTE